MSGKRRIVDKSFYQRSTHLGIFEISKSGLGFFLLTNFVSLVEMLRFKLFRYCVNAMGFKMDGKRMSGDMKKETLLESR